MSKRVFFGIAVLLAISLLLPAASFAQDGDDYTFTIVGGVEEPQTYADQEVEGIQFTTMTYRSLYPSGLEFRATITPPEGVTISQVTLFYTFATGKAGRVRAEQGENPDEWIAVPYAARGLPPWHEIDAYWGVRGPDDLSVNSEPVHAVYYDASREWYRAESEDIVVYWYGMPVELGQYVLEAMAANRARYIAGFGDTLPYRPMAVIFPPGGDWNEYKGDETVDDTDFGSTGTIISEAGSTIQRVRTLEPAAVRAECIWLPENPTVAWQMRQAASVTTHEVLHLYQEEWGVRGPFWWFEGQAKFFETQPMHPFHDRMRTLYELRGDLPTLQNSGPSGGPYTAAEDGCTHLGYDMGASFMTWLVEERDSMATFRTVVDEMSSGATLEQALETATGATLLELENEWRAFLGVPPVPAEVLDPALTLTEPVEPFVAVGEQFTLPTTPFQQPIYERPADNAVASAACFANNSVTILQAGSDGTTNWYEVDCMGMVGWMSQDQLGQQ
ncbi:MAG: hypothetical protein GYB65_18745 [Chloroflexi bacterium]|nr:hypothetical protein [Chloroflexota bacterium]